MGPNPLYHLRIATFFLVAFLVSGCTPKVIIMLYNNTNENFTVVGCGQAYEVQSARTAEFDPLTCSDHIEITRDGKTTSYTLVLPSWATSDKGVYYYKSIPWYRWSAAAIVCLQVNESGKVYVLSRNADFPVTEELPQPAGFPWIPE